MSASPDVRSGRAIRLLLIEDSEADAELVLREFVRLGYAPQVRRVETEPALKDALDSAEWDLIISDSSMPQFDALSAVGVVVSSGRDIPLLVVSGTLDEDSAVAALRAGARDFISKSKLARLIPAAEREIREASSREEKRKLHQSLLLSDRMASIGLLAAGVAHEINNPLAAVLANLHFALDTISSPEKSPTFLNDLSEAISDAFEASERVRQIVRDVRIFSRGSGEPLIEEPGGQADIARVLDSSARMAWSEIRPRARLLKQYGDVGAVSGSEARLGQVFLNLIVNAAQAISPGRPEANEIRLVTRVREPGWVVVEIADSGSGIAPEVLPQLFTPFFTTKQPGRGTGLGLSICRQIISSLGGEISVETEVGRGTTFSVTLPATDQPPRTLFNTSTELPAFVTDRRGRLLVVDNDLMVTTAIRRALGRYHDVAVAFSAERAVDRIRSGERFDVILCDLLMPQMDGMEMFQEISRLAPEQADRVVFMGGGPFGAGTLAFLESVPGRLVEKPFDRATLLAAVVPFMRPT